MGGATADGAGTESAALLIPQQQRQHHVPQDSFNIAYVMYCALGAGLYFPFNAFITAVDYFSYLYPEAAVDRAFSVVNFLSSVAALLPVIAFARKSDSFWSVNVGYVMFVVSLLSVPLVDAFYIKGEVGLYGGYYVAVGACGLCGVATSLVQASVTGSAGLLPKRYMQGLVAGTAVSSVMVSALRILTKAVCSQDGGGLRLSAAIYFVVGIAFMLLNIVFYNLSHKLAVVKYHQQLKAKDEASSLCLWEVAGSVKWYILSILITFAVTCSIFPGSVTADVQSSYLKDWYPIILVMAYNVSDLVGKSLTSIYIVENPGTAMVGAFARTLFLPAFYFCLKGPEVFRTEVPVTVLTCLLGLSNGYFASVLLIKGPKSVGRKDAETVGFLLVFVLVVGLAVGSVASWFWLL
ncbi:equilibrative nucleoside transporter 1 [Genlisea aurea]|uniref:Equilibrative nucleoside transporter 1 n=1 Tax=Genlisea aurea TaxID=192259 RepID=S8D0S7_9LAMI|nr:equilibrative nucleoside transporter 1 [Genlisea aurea]